MVDAAVRAVAADPRGRRAMVPWPRHRLRGIPVDPDGGEWHAGIRAVQAGPSGRPGAMVDPGPRARRRPHQGDHLLPRYGPPLPDVRATTPRQTGERDELGELAIHTDDADAAARTARGESEPSELVDDGEAGAAEVTDVD